MKSYCRIVMAIPQKGFDYWQFLDRPIVILFSAIIDHPVKAFQVHSSIVIFIDQYPVPVRVPINSNKDNPHSVDFILH